jgi:hypothetical protein
VRPERPRIRHVARFFPYRVYLNSNHRDTLGYEWPLACCCHLVVCHVVLMDDLEDYVMVIMVIIVILD